MSVAELGPGIPTADDAETAILGAIMATGLRNLEDLHLTPQDFWQTRHEAVYAAIERVVAAGNRPDLVTVRVALGQDPGFRGGHPEVFLAHLVESCPIGSQAEYYADLVGQAADRRGLAVISDHMRQMLQEGAEPGEVQDRVTKELAATPRRGGSVSRKWAEMEPSVIDHIERGARRGIPTPWPALNKHLVGLVGSRMYTIAARPGEGKALALETLLPTPTGWTTMGEVKVGDCLIGADGHPTQVTAVTDVMYGRPCFRLTFSDGATVVADGSHQWLTTTRQSRLQRRGEVESVKTTELIADSLRVGTEKRANHAVRAGEGWQLKPADDLPMDPYILGLWLGDGTSNGAQITTADPEIVESIRESGLPCRKLKAPYLWSLGNERNSGKAAQFLDALRELDLVKNKHVPCRYLRASYDQRLALMQGLIDTDGYISPTTGRVHFEVCSLRLARGAQELAVSLGWIPSWSTKQVAGHTEASSTCYKVSFLADAPAARLQRKVRNQKLTRRFAARFITSVERVASMPVRCVQVDAADHLYLASRSGIPTHNSLMGQAIAVSAAVNHRKRVLFASLEMSELDLGVRIYSDQANVPMHVLLSSHVPPHHWEAINKASNKLRGMGCHINADPNQSVADIRAEARSVRAELIVVDYLQLVKPSSKRGDRREQVDQIARDLKLLAKELDVPLVTLAQLNRSSESRADKTPAMSDLRESGAIEQDSDIVILMQHQPETGELKVNIPKNRHGSKAPFTLEMWGQYSRIVQPDAMSA